MYYTDIFQLENLGTNKYTHSDECMGTYICQLIASKSRDKS